MIASVVFPCSIYLDKSFSCTWSIDAAWCLVHCEKTTGLCRDLQLLTKIQSESEKAKTLLEQRSYLQYQRKQVCHAQR